MGECIRIAVVCSSNQNRSMEAHCFLSKKGFRVRSFGTGSQVKLPGPAPDRPNIYTFDTTYDEMYKDLFGKNPELLNNAGRHAELASCRSMINLDRCSKIILVNDLEIDQTWTEYNVYSSPAKFLGLKRYTQNGILHMLDRNRRLKPKPERFQATQERFDIIITCEERVYDQVIEELESRVKEENEPVHIINIDIQDNHEEATIGAFMICDLVSMLAEANDLDNDIDEILQEFEHRAERLIYHTAIFY